MQLSPQALLAGTGLQPDAEVLPGWTLFDVGWTRDRGGLRVELAGAGSPASVTLELRPGTSREVRGLGDRRELLVGIRAAWSRLVEAARGVRPPSREDLLTPFAPEPLPPEMPLPAGPEHGLITTELANYDRHCGVRPTVVDVGGGDPGVAYPPSETAAPLGALRALPCEILERRSHREFIAGLGFAIDREGLLRTVPTPQTFRRRVARLGADPGLLPVLRSIRGAQQGRGWTKSLLAGEFVVGVPRNWTLWVPMLRVPVSTLAHDLGFHCLPLQFVTAPQWARLRGAVAGRTEQGGVSSAGLTSWFEGPLTNACWEAWAQADTPREVPGLLEDRWAALCSAVPTRRPLPER